MTWEWPYSSPNDFVVYRVASRRLATTGFLGYLPPRRLKTCGYQNQKRIDSSCNLKSIRSPFSRAAKSSERSAGSMYRIATRFRGGFAPRAPLRKAYASRLNEDRESDIVPARCEPVFRRIRKELTSEKYPFPFSRDAQSS